jgi:hypothetical protein
VSEDVCWGFCLDNVASSLLKVMQATQTVTPESMQAWLSALPLTYDVQESMYNSLALVSMLDEEPRVALLAQPEFIPHVVRVLASVVGTEYLEERHTDRAITILTGIKHHVGKDAFNSYVPKDQTQRLSTIA